MRPRSDNLRQVGAGADRHEMRQVVARMPLAEWKVVVFDRLRTLRLEILPERATAGEIDHLQPATDSEHGLAVVHRPLCELELHAIARGVGAVTFRVALLTVVRGIDIGPAREEHTVELIVDAAERLPVLGNERDHPRNGSNGRERVNVPLAHGPRWREVGWNPAEALNDLRRDPDYWALGHGRQMKTASNNKRGARTGTPALGRKLASHV